MKLQHLHEDEFDDIESSGPVDDRDDFSTPNKKGNMAETTAIWLNRNEAYWSEASQYDRPEVRIPGVTKPVTQSLLVTDYCQGVRQDVRKDEAWVIDFGINYEELGPHTLPFFNYVFFSDGEWHPMHHVATNEGYNEFRNVRDD